MSCLRPAAAKLGRRQSRSPDEPRFCRLFYAPLDLLVERTCATDRGRFWPALTHESD